MARLVPYSSCPQPSHQLSALLCLWLRRTVCPRRHARLSTTKFHFNCQYDEKDSIGKRYRRQDAIGTPYCVTVDHDTLTDGKVTLRFRDTMEQERVNISDLNSIIEDKVSIASLLKKLQ